MHVRCTCRTLRRKLLCLLCVNCVLLRIGLLRSPTRLSTSFPSFPARLVARNSGISRGV